MNLRKNYKLIAFCKEQKRKVPVKQHHRRNKMHWQTANAQHQGKTTHKANCPNIHFTVLNQQKLRARDGSRTPPEPCSRVRVISQCAYISYAARAHSTPLRSLAYALPVCV